MAAALGEELGLLSDGARLVLQGAAVAGDPFEPELAAAAAATSEPAAVEALDELLLLDLVRPTEVPRRFRFRHPLVRRAVYESTPGGWRLGAHERSAEALAARGAPAAARAHHVELSAKHGDAAAVAILREAGEDAVRRAPATAARWFDGALRLVSDNVPPEERVELLLARAGSLSATGHFADSHAALLESIALVPADAVALRVRLVAACASMEHLLGLFPQARARLETALEELEDPDSPEATALMIELAVAGLYRSDFEAMTAWAERAVAAAKRLQDRALMAAALAVRACGAALSGTAAEAQAQCEEAAQLVDRLSDDELARRLDALVYLATAEGYLDRFEPSVSSRPEGDVDRTRDRARRPLPARLRDAANGAVGSRASSGVDRGARRRGRGRPSRRQRLQPRVGPLQSVLRPRSSQATSRPPGRSPRRASSWRAVSRQGPFRPGARSPWGRCCSRTARPPARPT